MVTLRRFVTALALLALILPGARAEQTAPTQGLRSNTPRAVAFTHATIVVAPGQVIENATLVARDGRIVAVGSGVSVPADAIEHDLAGKMIFPGFIDPYTEYGLGKVEDLNPSNDEDGPKYEGNRAGADSWNDAIHADLNWVDSFEADSKAAKGLMKRGFTVAQSVKMDGIFRGRGFTALLGEGLGNDLVLVPQTNHFASFNKGSSQQAYPSSQMGSIALTRQTFLDANWYTRVHAAYSVNPSLPIPELNRAIAALAANKQPIIFETTNELELLRAARISNEFSIPFIHIGSGYEYSRIKEVAATGQAIILPLSYPKTPPVQSFEDSLDVDLADLRHWERAPSNPAVLSENKVRFAFTSHGLRDDEDFLSNLRKAIRRGLNQDVALAALTTVPAEIAGVGGLAGTLETGKLANLFIADGNILEDDKAKIMSVWINGRMAEEYQPLVRADYRGTYTTTVAGTTYRVELTGEPDDLKGKVSIGEQSTDTGKITVEGNSIRFTLKLDDIGAAGIARISLIELDGLISGHVTLADGSMLPMALTDAPAEEPETEESASTDASESTDEETIVADRNDPSAPEVIVSRLTYPNNAFGFESLPKQENVVVRNATIWTSGKAGVIEQGDLLVANGKIVAVGTALNVPAGVREIDGAGKHVTAGVIDEHSHLGASGGVNEGSHAASAEVRIGDIVNSDQIGLYRALAGGVTASQVLHGSANPIGGQAQVIKHRWGSSPEAMKFTAAPPSIKFALGENVKQSNWGDDFTSRYPQTRMGVETFIRDRFLAAKRYGEEWKKYEALPRREKERAAPPRRDLQLETLFEILEGKRFVHTHSYVQSEILSLMRLAEDLGFRIQTFTHILEGYKVAPEMAKHGAGASSFADWWAYKFEVYDAIPYNPCLMQRHGVVTSVNSDSSELIRRLNTDAAKSVMYCGMDQIETVKMVTINPAIQLKVETRVGSLEPGKDADFVIWSGNPLSMYTKAEQTWVDGIPMFTIERDATLRVKSRNEKQALIQKVLAAGGGSDEKKDKKGRGPRGPDRNEEWHCDDNVDFWAITNARQGAGS